MILIIGRGYIGGKVAQWLGWKDADFVHVSHDSALACIQSMKPEAVVNCAAVTGNRNIDDCEKMKEATIAANAIFPVRVMNECERVKARLFHFSSGCVFMGSKDYTENDTPNFTDTVYIGSKIAAESVLKDRAVVMRIRLPFDANPHPKNLLTKLAHYAQTGYLVDSVNSISSADDVALACHALITKHAPDGIYHVTNGGAISTKEIVSEMGLSGKWMDWETFYMAGNGPKSQCTLSNAKLQDFYAMREVHEAIHKDTRLFRAAA